MFKGVFFLIFLLGACQSEFDSLQGYVEGELIYLSSPYGGSLQSLDKKIGVSIQAQAQVAVLEAQPQQAQYLAAEQDLIKAQANLTFSKTELVRAQALYKTGVFQKEKLDTANTLFLSNQASVEAAFYKKQELQWALDKKQLLSPVMGRINAHYFKVGEWVPAGTPVLSILAPENIKILFFIPEKQLHRVSVGDEIHVVLNKKKYKAQIETISNQVEFTPPVVFSRENDAKLVYRVKARPRLSQAIKFHPGQPVQVHLVK